MLAPRELSQEYEHWNSQHGAPFGHAIPFAKKCRRWLPKEWYWRWRGPFSVQRNNHTRTFEYPFAYAQLPVEKKPNLVDIGGGLSGLQFVLSQHGCDVMNIDPGMDAAGRGWPCTPESVMRLNRLFKTEVKLCNTTVDHAGLTTNSLDAAISISVVEHLPWSDIENVMQCVWKALKPGGLFVLTVDLFLDVQPFAQPLTNKYGSNIDIKKLVGVAPFLLELGNKEELNGYDEFDSNRIMAMKDQFLIGEGYPAMVQCLVLRKV